MNRLGSVVSAAEAGHGPVSGQLLDWHDARVEEPDALSALLTAAFEPLTHVSAPDPVSSVGPK
jgi:hypothetical protein